MDNKYILSRNKEASQRSLHFSLAAAAVFGLWVIYVVIEGLILAGRITQPLSAALEFIPGLLGLAVLLAAGFLAGDLFLQVRPLSRKGLFALLATVPLVLPVYLTGSWTGWKWENLLIYGPAGAISQELFFRCALLPVALRVFKGKPFLAIFVAALKHGLWHVGPVVQGAPWYGVLPVMMVPFLASIAWNWQVQHDRTVLWATILHILIDQGITLFAW